MTACEVREVDADASDALTTRAARALLAAVLRELGETPDREAIAHRLPQFRPVVSLADVRNALVGFGVTTVALRNPRRWDGIRATLVLYEPPDGGAPLLVRLSDGRTPMVWTGENFAPAPPWPAFARGRWYVFQREVVQNRRGTPRQWLFDVLGRFRSYLSGLMIVSAMVSLLAIASPIIIMIIYDRVIGQRSADALPMFAAALALLAAADFFFRSVKVRLLSRVAARLDYIIGVNVVAKLLRLPSARIEGAPVAAQVQRVRDFEALRDIFTGPVAAAVTEAPFVILTIAALVVIAGPLAGAPIVGGLALMTLHWIFGRANRALDRDAVEKQNAARAFVAEAASLRRAIERSDASRVWAQRFRWLSARAAQASARQAAAVLSLETASSVVMNAAALATVGGGALMVMEGALTAGGLIATMALTWKLLAPLQVIANAAGRIARVRAAATQINAFFALPEERQPRSLSTTSDRTPDSVSFERVSFRYPNTREAALVGLSFAVQPREFFAIAGPTGSGKSTIANLIMRLHEPMSGAILLGGSNIRQLSHHELRRSIGYVPQTDHIFSGAVRDNVMLGDPTRESDMLDWAVEMSGLNRAFAATGYDLDTVIGGAAAEPPPAKIVRAITFARALVRDPSILIIDEPEKGLDQSGAEAFLSLLAMELGERTIIIVSHRPSFLNKADRGVFIDRGAVVAEGTGAQIAERTMVRVAA